jgi:hypothetical protein
MHLSLILYALTLIALAIGAAIPNDWGFVPRQLYCSILGMILLIAAFFYLYIE